MFVKIDKDNAQEYAEMCKVFYDSPAVEHAIDPSVISRNIERFVHYNDCEGYLLKHDHQTIGYVLISFMYSTEMGMLDAWLEELYISDDYRGHGFGSRVLGDLKQKLADRCGRIRLEVTAVNRGAIELYKRHGFKMAAYEQMVYLTDLSNDGSSSSH